MNEHLRRRQTVSRHPGHPRPSVGGELPSPGSVAMVRASRPPGGEVTAVARASRLLSPELHPSADRRRADVHTVQTTFCSRCLIRVGVVVTINYTTLACIEGKGVIAGTIREERPPSPTHTWNHVGLFVLSPIRRRHNGRRWSPACLLVFLSHYERWSEEYLI